MYHVFEQPDTGSGEGEKNKKKICVRDSHPYVDTRPSYM